MMDYKDYILKFRNRSTGTEYECEMIIREQDYAKMIKKLSHIVRSISIHDLKSVKCEDEYDYEPPVEGKEIGGASETEYKNHIETDIRKVPSETKYAVGVNVKNLIRDRVSKDALEKLDAKLLVAELILRAFNIRG